MPERLNSEGQLLAEKNIRLVYYVLKEMCIKRSADNFDDLFGAGCVGLCKAALKWKSGLSPFSTFAFHLIKHEILGEIYSRSRAERNTGLFYETDIPVCEKYFDDTEFKMMLNDFCKISNKIMGKTAARVFRLSLTGKDCKQIAQLLGISVSSVEKSNKKAGNAFKIFLQGGIAAQLK
ncbi:MAG TPA: sigma-70 family RNA polymerase sigma factor [Ruminiclostridium sp.]|nr:sigma-70 family RNA polymerase sigma factor [Ruminiclostridium sp.]